jgi:hypothetical protein
MHCIAMNLRLKDDFIKIKILGHLPNVGVFPKWFFVLPESNNIGRALLSRP